MPRTDGYWGKPDNDSVEFKDNNHCAEHPCCHVELSTVSKQAT